MMPSVSPAGPIRRTSFAVISSLSRVSFSFALMVQHLHAKNKPYKDRSLRTDFSRALREMHLSTHGHNRCRGESGALCFVLPVYHTTQPSVCQEVFEKNSDFSFSALFPVLSAILIFPFLVFPGIPVGYDTDVYREKQQKSTPKRSENSPMYAFTQKFVLKFVRIPNLQNGRFAV